MDVRVTKVPPEAPELVDIRCHRVTEPVRQIVEFVRSRQSRLTGTMDGRQYAVPVGDVLYAGAVDERVFLYTAAGTYEVRERLYELEAALAPPTSCGSPAPSL